MSEKGFRIAILQAPNTLPAPGNPAMDALPLIKAIQEGAEPSDIAFHAGKYVRMLECKGEISKAAKASHAVGLSHHKKATGHRHSVAAFKAGTGDAEAFKKLMADKGYTTSTGKEHDGDDVVVVNHPMKESTGIKHQSKTRRFYMAMKALGLRPTKLSTDPEYSMGENVSEKITTRKGVRYPHVVAARAKEYGVPLHHVQKAWDQAKEDHESDGNFHPEHPGPNATPKQLKKYDQKRSEHWRGIASLFKDGFRDVLKQHGKRLKKVHDAIDKVQNGINPQEAAEVLWSFP